MIEVENKKISIRKQCELLNISRSMYYYAPKEESEDDIKIKDLLKKQYDLTPYYGVKKMTIVLRKKYKLELNPKRTRRLLRELGLHAIYRKPNLSQRDKSHEVYPYLLKDKEIGNVNEVWSTDITYIKIGMGKMYLSAVIDWYSRYIISWSLSNSLDKSVSIDTLKNALESGKPLIFNTDQGSQYTSKEHTSILKDAEIAISMDSVGQALDNIYIERFWRTFKYECLYLSVIEDGLDLYKAIENYINLYNHERLHQSLDYNTPWEVYSGQVKVKPIIPKKSKKNFEPMVKP